MRPMSAIEFGVNIRTASSGPQFRTLVKRVDELGFDVLAAPDHLGGLAPFTALSAAAMVSDRLRLRTYVLNVGFWNAALLAREAATLDVLSDGRAEIGLGAGHMKSEHEDARLPWLPLPDRVQHMADMLEQVRARLDDSDHRPRSVQHPLPIMVGAMSDAGLAVAARHADVVGFAGLRQIAGAPAGQLTFCSAAQTADQVTAVARLAGDRPYRSDALLQAVVIDSDPEQAATELVAELPGLTVEQVLDTPFVLLASSAREAAAELERRRLRYGFDSVTTHEPNLEALGAVIAAYRTS